VVEVEVLQGDVVVHRVALGERPLSVGRGPGNDLVFPHLSVSWQHATLWLDGNAVCLRDLGSTNGSWVGEERVSGTVTVAAGARVRLGHEVTLRVVRSDAPAPASVQSFAIEDVAGNVRIPLLTDRCVIGSGPDAQIRVDGPDRAATLLVHPGEVWLGVDDDRPLAPGEEFEVAGRRFRLVAVDAHRVPTAVPTADRYPYLADVALDGPTGPVATLSGPGGRSLTVEGNRAVLVWVLAKALAEDRAAGVPGEDAGWRPDGAVRSAIWGRSGDDNKLHVLIHRLRGDVEAAGLDPWCVEKKRRFVRIRVADVRMRGPGGP
jgi:hypothetical protein